MDIKMKKVIITVFSLIVIISISSINAAATLIKDDVYTIKIKNEKHNTDKNIIIHILPTGTKHCNVEYPWKLKVVKSTGATLSKPLFLNRDATLFSQKEVIFSLPVATKKKNATIMFELKLSICTETQCFMKTVPFSVLIN
jgi:hypothetical protein